MSFIIRLLGADLASRDPMDDHWYGLSAANSTAGVPINAETALKVSTVWACVGLLSETIGWLPLVVNRWMGQDSRERARNHPLYSVLHDQPNQWQTAMEFREMMTGHVLLRGNAYAQIVPGPRGPADQLIPIHPDRIPAGNVEKLPNGRLRYWVKQDDGTKKAFNQEDIFHIRGLSGDGLTGKSVIDYARDSFGLAIAAEQYGGRFFRNDSRPGGILRTDKSLSDGAAKRLKASWEAAHTGGNQNRVAVLEEGLQWQQIGISPEEAQFLGTKEYQAEDVCRWFRVPPHMVGLTSKATSWGSGIEQMGIGFVTYTLMPWLTRWTQAISRDLIIATDTYFADFIVEGLLRGDIGSRYNAYATARQWGWLSVNDIRRLENMNPVDNGDVYLQPLNMQEAGSISQEIPPSPNLSQGNKAHYRLLAEESAARLVRKEIAAIGRLGTDGRWFENVTNFYQEHVALVSQAMQIHPGKARAYCDRGRDDWLDTGPIMDSDFEARRVAELADLAMEA